MSGDDDDSSVIIIGKRIKETLSKPVTNLKRWHVVALMLAAFLLGALVF